jgi:hypothetical protein
MTGSRLSSSAVRLRRLSEWDCRLPPHFRSSPLQCPEASLMWWLPCLTDVARTAPMPPPLNRPDGLDGGHRSRLVDIWTYAPRVSPRYRVGCSRRAGREGLEE